MLAMDEAKDVKGGTGHLVYAHLFIPHPELGTVRNTLNSGH